MRSYNKRALVIGCGIAGPAVAMFLQRVGIEAVIFESVDAPNDDAGAFLNLMPNGIDVLATLGLAEEVGRHGHPTDRFVFQNGAGKQIGVMDLTGMEAAAGLRSILIKRGLLCRVLREAALQRGTRIEFGKKLVHIDHGQSGKVTAHFQDGTEAVGDFLIGCDGVHSRTRRFMLPGGPRPSYVGLLNLGAVTRMPGLPISSTMTMTFGKQAFFGYQAVPTGEVYWFSNIGVNEPDRASLAAISTDDWKQKLLALHGSDHEPIPSIIQAADGPIGAWPTYDLPSLPTWHSSSICLAGDAAHAVSPSAGQGASLALEDAVVFAQCLRDIDDVGKAFARYQELRKVRAEHVVQQGRRNGNNKAISNPLMRWLRDRLMPFFAKFGARATAEITSYRVDWDARVTSDA